MQHYSNDKFKKICKELEELDRQFLIKGVPKEYKEIWTPSNEVKLWQIPRSSAEILKAFALANKSKVILEMGTSAGYSALWLASAASQYGGKVYTIEIAKPKIRMAKKFFKKSGLNQFIKLIEGEIKEVLKKWNKKIDLVFLDADKHNYLNYIKQIEPFLKKGSVVIADNALDFGYLMKDYIDYVSKNPKYFSFLLKIDHGFMISIKL